MAEFQGPLAGRPDPTPGCPVCPPRLQPWTSSQEKGNKFHAQKETPSETWGEKVTAFPIPSLQKCRSVGRGRGPCPRHPHARPVGAKDPAYRARSLLTGLPWLQTGSGGQGGQQAPGRAPTLSSTVHAPPPSSLKSREPLGSSVRAATAHMGSDSTPTAGQTWGLHHRDGVHLSQVVPPDTRLPHQVSWGVSFGRYFLQ